MDRLLIAAGIALLAGLPAFAQTTVPPPLTPPDRPLPGQLPTPSVIITVPTVPPHPQIEPVPGQGGRAPLGDTSPSARPAGIGGQALGDTSPSGRAVGEGGRAIGDTSPSSVGAPVPRTPPPTPGEPGYTGSAIGIR